MLKNAMYVLLSIFSLGVYANETPLSEKKIRKLCEAYGKHSLHMNIEKATRLDQKIHEYGIDKELCEGYAKAKINKISPDYKSALCQNLAAFYYKGAYAEYKRTLKQIEHASFADDECITIGNFFIRRIELKEKRRAEVAAALAQLNQVVRTNTYQPFQLGSYYNPIHVKIQ